MKAEAIVGIRFSHNQVKVNVHYLSDGQFIGERKDITILARCQHLSQKAFAGFAGLVESQASNSIAIHKTWCPAENERGDDHQKLFNQKWVIGEAAADAETSLPMWRYFLQELTLGALALIGGTEAKVVDDHFSLVALTPEIEMFVEVKVPRKSKAVLALLKELEGRHYLRTSPTRGKVIFIRSITLQ
jgi:hypothetical protein